jgi:hypothetical protein
MSMIAKRRRTQPESFLKSLREFLTPALWKQAEKAQSKSRRPSRWMTQPLILTMLVMTWCCGDSQAERFEIAKGFTAVCLHKRRRPGRTVQGFQKALARLPMPVLRAVAAGLRRRLLHLFELRTDGWTVLGVDGSSLVCPRVAELDQGLDPPRRNGGPVLWVTVLVHLRTGLLWSWRLGRGYNRERQHLRTLLTTLPASALVVADAGYGGYDLAQALLAAGASFLIRVSAKDRLYSAAALRGGRLSSADQQLLWCWPQQARQKLQPPLQVRLLRLRDRRRRQEVWLLTNVLDKTRLSRTQAALYYRWRWENEGFFRTDKHTLAKVKLQSRTVRLVHREAEGALLATQVLLAQGVQALPRRLRALPVPRQGQAVPRCSPRQVLLAIREVILGHIGIRQQGAFRRRLAQALRDRRWRRSPKVKRSWPSRRPHVPLKPPKILTLTRTEKVLLFQLLDQAA